MIVNTNVPRIYYYNNRYYLIKGNIFYWIDIADLNDVHVVIKSEFRYQNFYTKRQSILLNEMFSNNDKINIREFLDKLFNWISDKVPVLNEEEKSKYIVANYNYRLIDVSKIL
jgi:hypothetical protein